VAKSLPASPGPHVVLGAETFLIEDMIRPPRTSKAARIKA
jgi:hypothetical protein